MKLSIQAYLNTIRIMILESKWSHHMCIICIICVTQKIKKKVKDMKRPRLKTWMIEHSSYQHKMRPLDTAQLTHVQPHQHIHDHACVPTCTTYTFRYRRSDTLMTSHHLLGHRNITPASVSFLTAPRCSAFHPHDQAWSRDAYSAHGSTRASSPHPGTSSNRSTQARVRVTWVGLSISKPLSIVLGREEEEGRNWPVWADVSHCT